MPENIHVYEIIKHTQGLRRLQCKCCYTSRYITAVHFPLQLEGHILLQQWFQAGDCKAFLAFLASILSNISIAGHLTNSFFIFDGLSRASLHQMPQSNSLLPGKPLTKLSISGLLPSICLAPNLIPSHFFTCIWKLNMGCKILSGSERHNQKFLKITLILSWSL